MQYIKKIGTDFETRGIECSQKHIDSCWNNDEGSYVNLVYDSSKLGELRKLLVAEEVYCCYCMRKLYLDKEGEHNKNVTLEHVIPHQIKEKEWEETKEEYLKFEPLQLCKVSVCYEGKYEHSTDKITELPHPHYVSYHNLVASCNGETLCFNGKSFKTVSHNCCNNKRQERFVMPIFYFDNVDKLLGYDEEGKLDYDEDYIKEEWFDNKHLNISSSWLNSVRRFWYELAHSGEYSAEDVERAITEKKLRNEIIDDVDPVAAIFPATITDSLWVILSEYSWFYSYYKNKEAA